MIRPQLFGREIRREILPEGPYRSDHVVPVRASLSKGTRAMTATSVSWQAGNEFVFGVLVQYCGATWAPSIFTAFGLTMPFHGSSLIDRDPALPRSGLPLPFRETRHVRPAWSSSVQSSFHVWIWRVETLQAGILEAHL